jgi:hypothetical protein
MITEVENGLHCFIWSGKRVVLLLAFADVGVAIECSNSSGPGYEKESDE